MGNTYLVYFIILLAGLGILTLVVIALKRNVFGTFRRKYQNRSKAVITAEAEEADRYSRQVAHIFMAVNKVFIFTLDSFMEENRGHMKEAIQMNDDLNRSTRKQKNSILPFLSSMKQSNIDTGHFYAQVIDYQREMAHSLRSIQVPLNSCLENRQLSFSEAENKELKGMVSSVEAFFNFALHIVKEQKFEDLDELVSLRLRIIQTLHDIELSEIQNGSDQEHSQASLHLAKALNETRNLLVNAVNLVKAHRDFMLVNQKL